MSRMQEQIMNEPPSVYAGIDVGKSQLDVFIHPSGIRLQAQNNRSSMLRLLRTLTGHGVDLVVMEATGKYHCRLHAMLHEAGVATAVINPFRSRQFADSIGKLAKTDTIDAETLALFGERMNPAPTTPPTPHTKLLHDLHTARRQVSNEVADLKRQLQTTDNPMASRQIEARIRLGQEHKKILEKELLTVIQSNAELKMKYDILISIPGIGKITAAIMLADLSELGCANARQISALSGVAPMNWDSGKRNGKRMIRGGRRCVRNALYMCAVACSRRSDCFGNTYRNLVQRGKPPKIALTAVMRKLVIVANTLISEGRLWQDTAPSSSYKPRLA